MSKKLIIVLVIFFWHTYVNANIKDKIKLNLKKTNNMTFNFEQTIDDKTEKGKCILQYPKKIYCSYSSDKIMVSTGKSLVIKSNKNSEYYIYPLKKTPLELILDKNFLISQFDGLEERIIEDKYVNFSLKENNSIINLFFDIKTLQLIGWQTEDIYQNLVITFISNIKVNQKIDKNIFKLPSIN